jgi:SPP1 family predicted phage head-tail adaptor
MNIAAMRVRVTFQKNAVTVDKYGNHKNGWTDYFSCWATAVASGKSAEETEHAATTQEADRLDITVRWSSETAAVDSKQYRVLLNGRIYDILNIDDMGFRRNSRKLHTQLVER